MSDKTIPTVSDDLEKITDMMDRDIEEWLEHLRTDEKAIFFLRQKIDRISDTIFWRSHIYEAIRKQAKREKG